MLTAPDPGVMAEIELSATAVSMAAPDFAAGALGLAAVQTILRWVLSEQRTPL
ncbi:MAG: hypothetical protein ACLQDM_20945 [Bradyrhizobium sp.]